MNQIAPEVPGLSRAALAGGLNRPGYRFFLAGHLLSPASKVWTEEQRARGVFVRMVYLTASEEERCLSEGEAKGKHSGIAQIRASVQALADVIDGEDGEPAPGPWKTIPVLEKDPYWEALGAQGRQLAGAAFNMANAPDEGAREAMKASFRIIG